MKRLAIVIMIFMVACASTPEEKSPVGKIEKVKYIPPEDPYFEVKALQRDIDLWHLTIWNNQVWENEIARQEEIRRQQQRRELRIRNAREKRTYGSQRCGGSLPSCEILACESGGDIRAENPYSSASGKWQIIDSTWGNYKGYPTASSAPEHIQDERAAQIYDGGRGRSHWVC